MAVVYLARDIRLGRAVALKMVVPTLAAAAAFRQRFLRESRAAAAVDDPHIIPVYEADEADGALFIAMRYVGGGDVHTLLRTAGSLPPGRAAAILSPVAAALDAAHRHDLVHRDVKPANMLLDVQPGRPDHVYLSDFGLAKGSLATAGLTGSGLFLGTLAYCAPEQIAGGLLSAQADEYSLACTAVELLSGAPPFEREQLAAVLWAHMHEPPPVLSTRCPDLPIEVDAVLSTALAKDPADRYPTCGEFTDALREALNLPRYHAPDPEQPPAPGPIQRERTVIAAGAKGLADAVPVRAEPPADAETGESEVTRTAARPAAVPAQPPERSGTPGDQQAPLVAGHTASTLTARHSRRKIAVAAAALVLLMAGGGTAVVLSLGHHSGQPRASGSDFVRYSLSCPSAGNCSAGGDETDTSGNMQAFVTGEVNGSWGQARQVPGSAALNAGGSAGVLAVSCSSAGNCSAGGYYTDTSDHVHAFVAGEVNGSWGQARQVPGSAALNAGGGAEVLAVSWASPGNCSAGGDYQDSSGADQAFVTDQVNGSWGQAQQVPGSAALNAGGGAQVLAVSCASPGNCSAGGYYTDASTDIQAFVAGEVNGSWGQAQQVPGSAALNAGGVAEVQAVSCASPGNCSAGGFYQDSSGAEQAFVADEVNGSWGQARPR